jgi:hypothetical protein
LSLGRYPVNLTDFTKNISVIGLCMWLDF